MFLFNTSMNDAQLVPGSLTCAIFVMRNAVQAAAVWTTRQQCSSELSNSPEKQFDPIRRGPLLLKLGRACSRSPWYHTSLQGKVQNICEPWTECLCGIHWMGNFLGGGMLISSKLFRTVKSFWESNFRPMRPRSTKTKWRREATEGVGGMEDYPML